MLPRPDGVAAAAGECTAEDGEGAVPPFFLPTAGEASAIGETAAAAAAGEGNGDNPPDFRLFLPPFDGDEAAAGAASAGEAAVSDFRFFPLAPAVSAGVGAPGLARLPALPVLFLVWRPRRRSDGEAGAAGLLSAAPVPALLPLALLLRRRCPPREPAPVPSLLPPPPPGLLAALAPPELCLFWSCCAATAAAVAAVAAAGREQERAAEASPRGIGLLSMPDHCSSTGTACTE